MLGNIMVAASVGVAGHESRPSAKWKVVSSEPRLLLSCEGQCGLALLEIHWIHSVLEFERNTENHNKSEVTIENHNKSKCRVVKLMIRTLAHTHRKREGRRGESQYKNK